MEAESVARDFSCRLRAWFGIKFSNPGNITSALLALPMFPGRKNQIYPKNPVGLELQVIAKRPREARIRCVAPPRNGNGKRMTKIFRTATEASGGVINHGVRYVLGASLTLVIVALIVAFTYQ